MKIVCFVLITCLVVHVSAWRFGEGRGNRNGTRFGHGREHNRIGSHDGHERSRNGSRFGHDHTGNGEHRQHAETGHAPAWRFGERRGDRNGTRFGHGRERNRIGSHDGHERSRNGSRFGHDHTGNDEHRQRARVGQGNRWGNNMFMGFRNAISRCLNSDVCTGENECKVFFDRVKASGLPDVSTVKERSKSASNAMKAKVNACRSCLQNANCFTEGGSE